MAAVYGRAWRLTAENGGFWPGQCAYDPNCLVWQAFPIEHGRSCYQGYTGMNITCHPPGSEGGEQEPTFMGGGRRATPPNPAFRTDYSFATADAASAVDSSWAVVDAPHDFISEYGTFTEDPSVTTTPPVTGPR